MPEGTERNHEEPQASVPTDRQTQRLRELENTYQDISGTMLEETTMVSYGRGRTRTDEIVVVAGNDIVFPTSKTQV
jgi:hypothetical protein